MKFNFRKFAILMSVLLFSLAPIMAFDEVLCSNGDCVYGGEISFLLDGDLEMMMEIDNVKTNSTYITFESEVITPFEISYDRITGILSYTMNGETLTHQAEIGMIYSELKIISFSRIGWDGVYIENLLIDNVFPISSVTGAVGGDSQPVTSGVTLMNFNSGENGFTLTGT